MVDGTLRTYLDTAFSVTNREAADNHMACRDMDDISDPPAIDDGGFTAFPQQSKGFANDNTFPIKSFSNKNGIKRPGSIMEVAIAVPLATALLKNCLLVTFPIFPSLFISG